MVDEIRYCKIHPAIGVARVGNSLTEYYVGPEAPGVAPEPPGGRFKDDHGAIKRQAARFRIYAYGAPKASGEENPLRELTLAEADIVWSVHLANRKAAHTEFRGRFYAQTAPLRNLQIPDKDHAREVLVIDGKRRSITGAYQEVGPITGTFGPLPRAAVLPETKGQRDEPDPTAKRGETPTPSPRPVPVKIGDLRTDREGRLLVLGGHGTSASVAGTGIGEYPLFPDDHQYYYANNDFWYDDTSDGPVTARVTLKDGRAIEVRESSWVLVAPPKYTPYHEAITTLYDTALETARTYFPDQAPKKGRVSFTRDIYPFLERIDNLAWVNASVYRGHGVGTGGFFIKPPSIPAAPSAPSAPSAPEPAPPASLLDLLASNSTTDDRAVQARRHVFARIRNPRNAPYSLSSEELARMDAPWDPQKYPEALPQANFRYMPQLSGDNSDAVTNDPTTWNVVLLSQYEMLEAWMKGDFDADWTGEPLAGKPLSAYAPAEQPAALDEAALRACIGGAFYPGIEMTYISKEKDTWSAPFRVNPSAGPGGITKHMALPWQADFYECNLNWWPSARPDDVVTQAAYEAVIKDYQAELDGPLAAALAERVLWARGLPDPTSLTSDPAGDDMMVKDWDKLGFIVKKTLETGRHQVAYVETERSRYACLTERDYFYYLMNIDSYPDFIPFCRTLVNGYLKQAQHNAENPETIAEDGSLWTYFTYTPDAYSARLDAIYQAYVQGNTDPDTYTQSLMQTRAAVIDELIQKAPFNQLDGAWLRGAVEPGPIDEVGTLLFQIYMDEYGDGIVERQHCNVYTDVLKSVNVYLPELFNRSYADDPRFRDSAFTVPVFLLAISQLSQEFFPEILGMTLYLEWGSIGLQPAKAKLEAFNIDPIYYTLHLGIDNASAGHGALARRAVMLHLEQVRIRDGEAAMQEVWRRIWTGYVAFGTLGTLGADALSPAPLTLYDRMQNLIVTKKPYGSQNHMKKMLGPNQINDWFEDPPAFLNQLVVSGMCVPGRPEVSPMMALMGFQGPMFHVFTEEEQQLWTDWILAGCPLNDPDGPDPEPPRIGTARNMRTVVENMAQRQMGVTGHQVRLLGPDPRGSRLDDLATWVSQPIHFWFDRVMTERTGTLILDTENTRETPQDKASLLTWTTAFMAALRHEPNGWIVRTNPMASPLVTSLLAGNGAMATIMQAPVPWSTPDAPVTYKEVIVDWITWDCPLTDAPLADASLTAAKALTAKAPAARKGRKQFLGMGSVH